MQSQGNIRVVEMLRYLYHHTDESHPATVTMVIYTFIGGSANTAIEAGQYNILLVLPYIIVLVTALMGINVAVVLFLGILTTGIIGIPMGTVTFFGWIEGIAGGMSDMFSISIVAALISGIIGIIRYYGGIEWIKALK